jgi:hypothetical protein
VHARFEGAGRHPLRIFPQTENGHTVYAMERAKTVGALKAVSQHLMHSSLTGTDGILGTLTADETAERITSLSAQDRQEGGDVPARALEQLKAILAQLSLCTK